MTTLREAAQQALEALEWHYHQGHSNTLGGMRLKIDEKALRNLKAALAEPEYPRGQASTDVGVPVFVVKKAEPQKPCNKSCAPGYCYCDPVQRKPPATIDEMFDRMDKAPKGVFFGVYGDVMTIWMEAWRAAEQHHGIK